MLEVIHTLRAPTTPCEDTETLCTLCPALILDFVFHISSKGDGHNRHRGRRRGGRHLSFSSRWLMRETSAAASSLVPPFDEGVHSDDLIHEVENYTERAEGNAQAQLPENGLPLFSNLPCTLSSMNTCTSTGEVGTSTSG